MKIILRNNGNNEVPTRDTDTTKVQLILQEFM